MSAKNKFFPEKSFRLGVDWSFHNIHRCNASNDYFFPSSTPLKSRKLPFRSETFFADESFLLGNDKLFTAHVGAMHLMSIFFLLVCTIVIKVYACKLWNLICWLLYLDWSFYSKRMCNYSSDKFSPCFTLLRSRYRYRPVRSEYFFAEKSLLLGIDRSFWSTVGSLFLMLNFFLLL